MYLKKKIFDYNTTRREEEEAKGMSPGFEDEIKLWVGGPRVKEQQFPDSFL